MKNYEMVEKIFKKRNNTEEIKYLKPIRMDNIKEAIFNHLKMKTTGALMLTGEWGSGKTYYVKNEIIPIIEENTNFIPIIVSLFGETDKNNIAQKVLFSYFDKKGKDVNLSTGTIAKNLKNLSEAIPFIKNYVDINKVIVGTGENIFKFLPHKKLLIIFDDVERLSSEKISIDDFLGFINDLIENIEAKVILVVNYEKIEDKMSYKEKTIEKTIQFVPNFFSVYDDIIKDYKTEYKDYYKYLKENKEFILKTINPDIDNEEYKKELQKTFSNIRTLKFALEHFRLTFNIITNNKKANNEIISKQLKNIWIFTISVSVEFKKPNSITFNDKKGLDKQSNIADIDLKLLGIKQNDNKDQKKVTDYPAKFKEMYYNRLSEAYIFFPNVYNFITGGRKINETDFLNNLEKSFNIQEGKVNPAHELLKTFMYYGFWSFNNKEFPKKLKELLNYCKNGDFEDIVSYLNAGVYLIGFNDFIEITHEEINEIIKKGIDKLLKHIKLNYYVKSQFDMVATDFSRQNLKDIVDYIRKRFKDIEEKNYKEEAQRLEQLLIKDLDEFINEFMHKDNSGIRTPDTPIFNQFDQEKVKNVVKNWEPKSIMNLSLLFKIRYLDTGSSSYLKDEKIFLESIKNSISELQDKTTLSNYILKTQLLPRINECLERLK